MRIGLALPTHDDVKTDFALSLLATDWFPHQLSILNVRSSLIMKSRRILVQKAFETNCDSVFFVDSDISFPYYAFKQLVSHDKDIVGCVYLMRQSPYQLVGTGRIGEREIPKSAIGLLKVHKMPIGFSLIKMEVFNKIPSPWFTLDYIGELDDYEPEDYAFCARARHVGYDLWVDLDLSHEIKHIGQAEYIWHKCD